MEAIFDFLLRVVEKMPQHVWDLFLATTITWGLTQQFKFIMPLDWAPRIRAIITQLFAFLMGFGLTYALWETKYGAVAGLFVGVWSPTAYSLTLKIVKHRWPWLADKMSGDIRE